MSGSNLTAKYRPQRFSDVAGQRALKSVLSRAAAENRIAPAYLFSGTRGVGKTTLARILAKAVNCEQAPTAEPCNKCRHCRAITAGTAVDVVEIDAASNRGIDDARRLKEDIGYAPLECRYKVFIIDEAHMLTREAFNALLKTLEEPPPHACFVLATTEPHKFPATIISRCQHYTFKRLLQKELEAHLSWLLEQEGIPFEPAAVSLIARRGSGSVRDTMSLLSQVLALGSDSLSDDDARAVLGLAGQEVFFEIMAGVHGRDCPALSRILRQVLDQGLDLGFFLRELSTAWRNMFLLRQAGEAAVELMEMAPYEVDAWKEWAGKFDLPHIHACWQMTLEGQRRVLTSLEPAMALELLLFNLACLPQLVNLDDPGALPPPVSRPGQANSQQAGVSASGPVQAGTAQKKTLQPKPVASAVSTSPYSSTGDSAVSEEVSVHGTKRSEESKPGVQTEKLARSTRPPREDSPEDLPPWEEQSDKPDAQPAEIKIQSVVATSVDRPVESLAHYEDDSEDEGPALSVGSARCSSGVTSSVRTDAQGFMEFVAHRFEEKGEQLNGLGRVKARFFQGCLTLECMGHTHVKSLSANGHMEQVEHLANEYFGAGTLVRLDVKGTSPDKSMKQIRDEVLSHPSIEGILKTFGAQVVKISRS